MRTIFVSEERCIRNILRTRLGVEWQGTLSVVAEYCVPPDKQSRGPIFNRDFVLYFVDPDGIENFCSRCAHVLPNTLGSEVFVTVDRKTHEPLMAELLSGAAFPLRYFKRYVAEVENELARLGMHISIRKCVECRIFVIADEICFLCFLAEEFRSVDITPKLLRNDAEACIGIYRKNQQLLCIDGWLKTVATQSDRYLIAEPR